MMEMLLIMVMVVQRYRVHLVSCYREELDCVLDMMPRHRVQATLQRRADHGASGAIDADAAAVSQL